MSRMFFVVLRGFFCYFLLLFLRVCNKQGEKGVKGLKDYWKG
jgi:hypothetical protein